MKRPRKPSVQVKNDYISFRVNTALRRRLEDIADREDRTISWVCINMMQRALYDYDKDPQLRGPWTKAYEDISDRGSD